MTGNLSAKTLVLEQQIAWARSSEKEVSKKGYVDSVNANLLQPLSAVALRGFDKGHGSELIDTYERPAKIKALHSSAALAVNVFDYWITRNPAPIAAAMGLTCAINRIEFERQFPTGLGGNPPNLDVVLSLVSGETIAIESKFTEWMTPKTIGKEAFRPAYFPNFGGVWERVGLSQCQQLAEKVASGRERFRWLDVPQLLKHALGLANTVPGQFSLRYVFFGTDGKEGNAHQEEIDRFALAVGSEIGFSSYSYQSLYSNIVRASEPTDIGYVTYLRDRYFSV